MPPGEPGRQPVSLGNRMMSKERRKSAIGRLLARPQARSWYLLPLAAMAVWQIVTGVPPLGHYREIGIAGEPTAVVQLSALLSSVDVTAQNLLHLPAFFVITWLWCWALRPGRSVQRTSAVALTIGVLFGLSNELSQFLVPYRYPSSLDTLLNVLGAGLAAVVYRSTELQRSESRPRRT